MKLKLPIICILLVSSTLVAAYPRSLMESLLHFFFVEGEGQLRNEPRDQKTINKIYDFIIIGAGSAGCVVANRLSEIKDSSVLLIEAGGEENILMDIPLTANYWQFSQANWKYRTVTSSKYCLGMENRQCHWPRGKVMGGSSILNYMIYTRGSREDYDEWMEMGNKGWGWDDVLPYFKKLEDVTVPDFALNREPKIDKGYMSVTDVPYKTPIGKAFVESGLNLGHPLIDYNNDYLVGFKHLIVSMKNGTRWSSSRAFLHSVNDRLNLHVKKRSTVTKIIIDPITKIAKGVQFVNNGKTYTVNARKEIILSGGTINSPQLLMLSGVGPKEDLEKLHIPIIQDSKVGYNLHDHYMPGGLTYLTKENYAFHIEDLFTNQTIMMDYLNYHTGPMASPGGCEAVGFMNLNNTTTKFAPNMEILLILGSIPADKTLQVNFNLKRSLYNEYFKPIENIKALMTFPVLLDSKSRGRVVLKDKNPFHYPLIYPNYFSDPDGYDMKTIIAGIRISNEIMSMPPLKKLQTKLYDMPLPPCKRHKFDSDEYWECFARHMTFTIYHPVGTCKMGPDNDTTAVVDERLRVRGVKHLRVIDASIMPSIVRAHINAPTYMIAEKGSDMIIEDWGLKKNKNS